VHEFSSLLSDAHCPVSINVQTNICYTSHHDKHVETNKITENYILWDEQKTDQFNLNLNYEKITEVKNYLDTLSQDPQITQDKIDKCVQDIELIFTKNCQKTFGFKKQNYKEIDKIREKKPWFNQACKKMRNKYHVARKLYNKNKTSTNKLLLKNVSKQYKNCISKSFKIYKNERLMRIRNLKSDKPKEYWKIINSINKSQPESQAALTDLYAFFKTVNAGPLINDERDEELEGNQTFEGEINQEINNQITDEEIIKAVKTLKNNKSPGLDNILNEHIKISINKMLPIYNKLFNVIFNTGQIPVNWTKGVILPIYKNKGNIESPENYRPITLLSCLGKMFTAILNNRLTKYTDNNGIIKNCQSGFRKDYSTTDNLFILQSLIEILRVKKKKLFCAFIDFKQAFDTVWRNGLWSKLLNHNINGKFLNVIKSMYENIKSCIRTSEGVSPFFISTIGVRQGENLSPMLFSLYLNDLETFFNYHNARGVECEINNEQLLLYLKLFVILYADDTVLLSDTSKDLQKQLNLFEEYCKQWKLTVNTDKTKIVIFGSRVANDQTLYIFNNKRLEIVNEYKYLGIYLSKQEVI
jgi:predicted peroxiredoxin